MLGSGRQNAPLLVMLACVVVLALLVAGVVYATSPGEVRRPASSNDIVITLGSCASGWKAPPSGQPTFLVRNDSDDPYEVQLVAVDSQRAYASIEVLGARTQRPLRVSLPPGQYRWQCGDLKGPATISEIVAVSGAPVGVAYPAPPEHETASIAAVIAYRQRVDAGLQQLSNDVRELVAAADRGDRSGAQAAWLRAHLDYARLGAAYDTFGDAADGIDGRGQGFHRIEQLLWGGAPMGSIATAARALDADVAALVTDFPTQPTAANDISLRAHEILENTLQFELTGATDNGSHTNLATARANVDGTELTLAVLSPQLRRVDPALLARVSVQLTALGHRLDGYQQGGKWVPLAALTRAQRQQLDAATSSLLESLSPVPDLLELDPNVQP